MVLPLASYRLNTYSELECLIAKMGAENYFPYREMVYSTLLKIKPGESFILRKQVKKENLELFIKISCLYMLETGMNCNIIFSDDYTIIRGIFPYEKDNTGRNNYNKLQNKYKRK